MKALRILNLEDDSLDTELVHATLVKGGIDCEILQVYTRADFVTALESDSIDLILADYSLPAFDGLAALQVAQEMRPEVPFVLFSGTLGEERAIEALKSGATDYVLKHRLERLVPAVRRAVREAEERTERQRAEEALKESERRLQDLVRKLLVAQEEERRRVAYEIHDGVAQVAIATYQHLQIFADAHPPGSKVGPGELDRTLELAQQTVKEARGVIEGLRPIALDDFGLAVAVRQQVEGLRDEGFEIGYEETLGERCLTPQAETELYSVAREALANVKKHARTTRAQVKLARLPEKVRLEVKDEGRGFEPVFRACARGSCCWGGGLRSKATRELAPP